MVDEEAGMWEHADMAAEAGVVPAGIVEEVEVVAPVWSKLRIFLSLVVLIALFFAVQVGGVVCVLTYELVLNPKLNVNAWANTAEQNGLVLSVVTILGACVCVPAIRLIVGLIENRPWSFLGFVSTPRASYLIYGAMFALFLAASDTLTWMLGRPIVPPFMIAAYASVGSPLWLFIALTVAAPLFEEVAFRGFLFGALRSRGIAFIWCAVVTSFFWSVIHLQYDLYGIGTIFLLGLLLAWARFRTGSILPPLAMHALGNAIAFFEAVWEAG